MHVKGHIRDVFTGCLHSWDRESEWWAPLEDVGSSHFPDPKLRRQWAGMNKEDRARWLIGQLWNCTDVCPREVAGRLDIPEGTYASVVRRLAVTDPPDAFAELIRSIEKGQPPRRDAPAGVRAVPSSP